MTFFDDFKRNASDAANKAVKKTEELTNIAKLNINLKTNEAKLCGIYEIIGRMFYEAEREGADNTADITSAIMKADKINSEISSIKKEIAKLRKVTICENCGKEISDEALFCSFCGAKQEKPEPETTEECGCGCTEECDCTDDCGCTDECECSDECCCSDECGCETECETSGSCYCGCENTDSEVNE